MKKNFEKWMVDIDGRKKPVASTYAAAIDRISQHYSSETGRKIDIYQNKDIQVLKGICKEYKRGGKFEDFGDERNGLYRAAISKFVRYFEEIGGNDNSDFDEETNFSVSDGKIAVKKNSTGKITISMSLQMEEVKE